MRESFSRSSDSTRNVMPPWLVNLTELLKNVSKIVDL